MDCDDQVRLVKRNDDPHANAPDLSRVAWLPFVVSISANGMCDDLFCIGDAEAMLTGPVLGMSRKMHAPSRIWRPNLSPSTSITGIRNQFLDSGQLIFYVANCKYAPFVVAGAPSHTFTVTYGAPPIE